MNIYFVLSEWIYHVEWIDRFDNLGYRDDYCIATYVRARNRSQAKYLAWREDPDTYGGAMGDMPRMSVRMILRDVGGEAGPISWDDPLINDLEAAKDALIASDAKYKRHVDELLAVPLVDA